MFISLEDKEAGMYDVHRYMLKTLMNVFVKYLRIIIALEYLCDLFFGINKLLRISSSYIRKN